MTDERHGEKERDAHRDVSRTYLGDLPSARPHIHETRRFPEGFLWGSATSAHQIEGGDTRNDWHAWEFSEGHVLDGMASGDACDHWNRYEGDFDLLEDMHQNAYRLSVEWSRIEPEEGVWDHDAITRYRKMLESLRRRGISVMLTIW